MSEGSGFHKSTKIETLRKNMNKEKEENWSTYKCLIESK